MDQPVYLDPLQEITLLESLQLPHPAPPLPVVPSCDLLMDKFQYVANRLCRHMDQPVYFDPLPEITTLESLQFQEPVYLRLIGSIHFITKLVSFSQYEETPQIHSNYIPSDFHLYTLEFTYHPDTFHSLVCEYIQNNCVPDIQDHLNIDVYIKSQQLFDTHVLVNIVFYHKIRYLKFSGKIHPITNLIQIDSSTWVHEIDTTPPQKNLNLPNNIQLPVLHSDTNSITKYIEHNKDLFTTHRGIHIYVYPTNHNSIEHEMIQMVLSDEPYYSDTEDADSYQIDSTTDSDSDTDSAYS
jgi:hypothetical protein